MKLLRILIALVITCFACLILAPKAWAFCGFYVAKADTKLYNQASQVAIARNGNKTVLTMANDYQGEVEDFAIVVPVPVVLQKEQVQVGDPNVMAHLDAFSAPRLVEYFDPNPCEPGYDFQSPRAAPGRTGGAGSRNQSLERRDLGVTIEAKFTVGEYDILILSAKESGGLETWLNQNGYKIPKGAKDLLRPYIRQNMKFFVAKVNLGELAKSGYQNLRPLQMTYESPRFMLPIRLGMVNAQNEQDLVVYVLTPTGQAEVTNYRTVKVPSDAEIPVFVKTEFSDFYKSMFQTSYVREGKNVAFLEYFWNMGNCDPCAADPLSPTELKAAGVFWLDNPDLTTGFPGRSPGGRRFRPSTNVYITRLHVRYTRRTFPEDLMFQETSNQQPFQGRYVLRHSFSGTMTCPRAREYQRSLPRRFEQEAQTLARLTGWNIQEIRDKLPKVKLSLFWWQ
ncbi:DUF2330 domain-containing protein [Pantanalinema sp. GBBB05]|uniref:DUF2330 domain-containing protein n=1 Tax=Pantanalinema sp. GBBB05 TaxID=2604139 RepID=UPI001DE321AA|nr:DUF2330 domain-containing protein [Pantanalinema sp. GBBB05]